MYTDSYGVDLVFKANISIAGATSAAVLIQPPRSGKRRRAGVEKAASISDEDNGIIIYRTAIGDFPNTGEYKLQVILYFSGTRKLRSDVVTIDVEEALA